MRSRTRVAITITLVAALPGCYFSRIENDVDRTPQMDAGAGATILMPGESAPTIAPGESAPGRSAAPGAPISTIGGTHVDEERHLSAREEPVWWKYLTLPFAVVAAPFKLAADSASAPADPGPAAPEQAPPSPPPAPSEPQLDYESARLQQLERELDQRTRAEPATRPVARTSIADELAALQRTPSGGRAAGAAAAAQPAPADSPGRSALAPIAEADGIVDRNGDGRVDLWIYRRDGRIVRRVVDDDFDGRADRSMLYDPTTQELASVEEDTDQDGAVDAWSEYRDGQIQRRRADSDHDGTVDTWTLYRDGEPVRHEQDSTGDGFRDRVGFYREGRLERDEVDTNADGRPDLWNHYDEGGQVVRREEDGDFDGEVDRISHFESGRLARREIIDPRSR